MVLFKWQEEKKNKPITRNRADKKLFSNECQTIFTPASRQRNDTKIRNLEKTRRFLEATLEKILQISKTLSIRRSGVLLFKEFARKQKNLPDTSRP